MDVGELHAALIDMVRTWVQAEAERNPKPYGFLVRDLRHPLVHEANMVWIDRAPEDGMSSILADLDDAFVGTSVGHRYILFADAQDAFLHQQGLVAAGFNALAELVMAKVGLPSCIVNPELEIREVGMAASEDDYHLVQESVHRESHYSPEESQQVSEVERARGSAMGERAFVGYLGDDPASTYSLWPRGLFAVIGSVATLPKFRMRGIARTMIFDACQRAINERCEYALLTTNLFETPQAMYKSLGFEPVGELRGFLKRGNL